MLLTISNNYYSVSVNTLGAELCSIVSKECNGEFVWQGDANIWVNKAKNAFPVCGLSNGNEITLEGKHYPMPLHGFAKLSEFCVAEQTESSVMLLLVSNSDSRKYYPFDFEFFVIYTLDGDKLLYDYKVVNKSHCTMYCSVGAHTGFVLPSDGTNSYKLQLDNSLQLMEQKDGYITGKLLPFETEGVVDICDNYFDGGSILLTGFKNKRVKLFGNKKYYFSIDFSDFDNLVLWQVPGKSHYVAIEPWCGAPDSVNGTPLNLRKNIIAIKENESIKRRQIITCGEEQ